MELIKDCKAIYVQIEDGFEAECTNNSLGRYQAESINDVMEIFRNECAQLLNIDKQFISVQINRVRKL